jgi:hypothetical protein
MNHPTPEGIILEAVALIGLLVILYAVSITFGGRQ